MDSIEACGKESRWSTRMRSGEEKTTKAKDWSARGSEEEEEEEESGSRKPKGRRDEEKELSRIGSSR